MAAEGFTMTKSVFTSPYSRAAAMKLGFEEVHRLYFKDAMNPDGNPIFSQYELTDEHYGALLCKKIRKRENFLIFWILEKNKGFTL